MFRKELSHPHGPAPLWVGLCSLLAPSSACALPSLPPALPPERHRGSSQTQSLPVGLGVQKIQEPANQAGFGSETSILHKHDQPCWHLWTPVQVASDSIIQMPYGSWSSRPDQTVPQSPWARRGWEAVSRRGENSHSSLPAILLPTSAHRGITSHGTTDARHLPGGKGEGAPPSLPPLTSLTTCTVQFKRKPQSLRKCLRISPEMSSQAL